MLVALDEAAAFTDAEIAAAIAEVGAGGDPAHEYPLRPVRIPRCWEGAASATPTTS